MKTVHKKTVSVYIMSLIAIGLLISPAVMSGEARIIEASEARTHARYNLVKAVQQKLLHEDYQPGAVDGIYGPQTRAALKVFQRDNGLPENGEMTRETLQKLGLGE